MVYHLTTIKIYKLERCISTEQKLTNLANGQTLLTRIFMFAGKKVILCSDKLFQWICLMYFEELETSETI